MLDAGGRRLRHVVPGRHRGGVPGGEPGPDGHAAPHPAPVLRRPRDRGGDHPARAHPGRVGAPLHPPAPGARSPRPPAPAARSGRWQKTLGVPLFQEQLMQIAIDAAGFTPAEADELRQAMSAKRSGARMARLSDRLFAGMAERGITGEVAEEIVDKLAAFANFGFPESHAVSFAYLVYSSAWLKLHYPAAFCAGLLNAQPMGFWSPQSLGGRCPAPRRDGAPPARRRVGGRRPRLDWGLDGPGRGRRAHRRRQPAVRLGLTSVRGVGEAVAQRIAESRPYASVEDLVRRTGTGRAPARGARHRRRPRRARPARRRRRRCTEGAGARCGRPGRSPRPPPTGCPGSCREKRPRRFPTSPRSRRWRPTCGPPASPWGRRRWSSPAPRLDAMGVIPAGRLAGPRPTARCSWAGWSPTASAPRAPRAPCSSTSRTRPGWSTSSARPAPGSGGGPWPGGLPALLVRGRIERVDGVVSVVAEKIVPLDLGPPPSSSRSRDFR